MQFILTSRQFNFEEGDASLFRSDAAGSLPGLLWDGRLRSNTIEYRGVVSPGYFLLQVRNCLVQSQLSQLSRRIIAAMFQGSISSDDIQQNRVEIPVGVRSLMRIEVVGGDGKPTQLEPLIGVSVREMTLEARVNKQGHFDILAPVGQGMIYLFERPSIRVPFDIQVGKEDAGTFTLQIPDSDQKSKPVSS